MKYVKKDSVVKPTSDDLIGAYIAAGWKEASKEEYERTLPDIRKPNPHITSRRDEN